MGFSNLILRLEVHNDYLTKPSLFLFLFLGTSFLAQVSWHKFLGTNLLAQILSKDKECAGTGSGFLIE
jgi:hypothetical protein